MKIKKLKILGMLVVLALVMNIISVGAENFSFVDEEEIEVEERTILRTRDIPEAVEEFGTVRNFESGLLSKYYIPKAISIESVQEHGHVERLYEKENDFSTIFFANADGTETAYLFFEDVKYIDENGEVADKSNELFDDFESEIFYDYAYANKENDIITYFPQTLSSEFGIALEHEERFIKLSPANDLKSDVFTRGDVAYYDGAFGEETKLRYQTTFSGFKEDIILNSYVGNEFRFILEACGLTAVHDENNGVNLIDVKTKEIFGTISPIFVYDSFVGTSRECDVNFTYDNRFEIISISEGQYEIIVIVDDDFLRNPNTVYPVFVDPTYTLVATSGTNKHILDTPIYNGSGAAGIRSGGNQTAVVGFAGVQTNGANYGAGRLLMRFPGLFLQDFMYDSGYIINSANIILREQSGNSNSATIEAYFYTGPAWDETTIFSSTIWSGFGSRLSSVAFSSSPVNGSFNITAAVRHWQKDVHGRLDGLLKGVMFRNVTSETSATPRKIFAQTEAGSNRPSLVVNYTIPVTYRSAEEAALAWANQTYSTSFFVRHEHASVIYRVGNYQYRLTETVSYTNKPHNIPLSVGIQSIPSGTKISALVHTHNVFNPSIFSDGDMNWARTASNSNGGVGVFMYVVSPTSLASTSFRLYRYNPFSNSITSHSTVTLRNLTTSEQTTLTNRYRSSWFNHFNSNGTCVNGVTNCHDKLAWPRR
jgi:hypothetical protein